MKRQLAEVDPFSGLDLPSGGGVKFFDDDGGGGFDQGWDGAGADEDDDPAAAGVEDAAAAASTAAEEELEPAADDTHDAAATAAEEAALPPWMRAANASIIAPRSPKTSVLGLDPRLEAALTRMGVRKCFPVQACVVPVALAAHAARVSADLCVCAPTGSGKTLAYALPLVQSLLPRVVCRLRALVLLPTRGLAAQVGAIFDALCESTPLRVGLAAGHEASSWERERAAICGATARRGAAGAAGASSAGSSVDILVATPGRLVEHLQHADGAVGLQHLRWLVVDEADRLLSQVSNPRNHTHPTRHIPHVPTPTSPPAAALARGTKAGCSWCSRPRTARTLGSSVAPPPRRSHARGAPDWEEPHLSPAGRHSHCRGPTHPSSSSSSPPR